MIKDSNFETIEPTRTRGKVSIVRGNIGALSVSTEAWFTPLVPGNLLTETTIINRVTGRRYGTIQRLFEIT